MDGRTNTEEDDWMDFEYAYDKKWVSKLKTNKKKRFDSSINNGIQY